MERVCVFIDGSNFYHNLRNRIGFTWIDFERFTIKLTECIEPDAKLVRCYYYTAPVNYELFPETARKQQRFLSYLRSVPKFEVRLGRLEKRIVKCALCGEPAKIVCSTCENEQDCYFIEKEVDVSLAVNMLSFARQNMYDTGILVSDDGDYSSALEELKFMGKVPVFAGFSLTRVLMDQADKFIRLDKMFFRGLKLKR